MSTPKSGTASSRKSILRSTSILSAGTLLSRVLGFIRDMIFANMLGTAAMADAFFVAFRIPNLLRDLVGEGATNAALVPVLSRYVQKHDIKKTNAFLSAVIIWALVILGSITVLGILFAPVVVSAIAPGFRADPAKFAMTVDLTRIMFPYLIFIGLTAYSMGVLYTYGSFVAPAFSSCFLNIILIVTTVMAAQHMDRAVYILAAGVLIGGLAQLVYQWVPLRTLGLRFEFPKQLRHEGALEMGRLLMPRLWGSAVYQMNVFVDTLCASLAHIVGAGGISAIYYSNRIIQFPLGIFGVAIASATLPTLSRYAANNDPEGLRSTLVFSFKNILFLLLPSSVVAIVLAVPIVRVVFERGQFDPYSTAITAHALEFYAIGLTAFGCVKIAASAFYALGDTRTPVKAAFIGLILNVVLNMILMHPYKVGGIALASSISGIVNVGILLYLLDRKIRGVVSEVLEFLWQMILPLLFLAAVTLVCYNVCGVFSLWMRIAVVSAAGLLSFFAASLVFKIEPAVVCGNWLIKKIKKVIASRTK